ncbi:MAG TPA: S-methyl-5'-thioinosine phosphorylase [Methylophilaceae bacterium]|jgi:5'-methylthioinosine phosphorylase|nr:S-methyl-5'-thioinosine phosphorylase [Methylophilaceae bacterium]
MLGIIGGTGLTQLTSLEITHRQVIRTPYGEPSGPLTYGSINNHQVVFLARHGYGHTIPPHLVNYRANLWALYSEGVKDVVSVATVGGIHPDLTPGSIVIPNQIIDYTHGRKATFHDMVDKPVTHIDFTDPYCHDMRALCMQAATAAGEGFIDGGVYAAVQGPRLETAAEINRLERDGATMVGMTGMPEAALARELDISYAALGVVANHAAGRGTSAQGIHYEAIGNVLNETMHRVRRILEQMVEIHAE